MFMYVSHSHLKPTRMCCHRRSSQTRTQGLVSSPIWMLILVVATSSRPLRQSLGLVVALPPRASPFNASFPYSSQRSSPRRVHRTTTSSIQTASSRGQCKYPYSSSEVVLRTDSSHCWEFCAIDHEEDYLAVSERSKATLVDTHRMTMTDD